MFKLTKLSLLSLLIPILVFSYINPGLIALGKEASTSATANKDSARITALQTRGDKEIDRRINSLNQVITRISSLKKLSQDQKLSLTTQVQQEITSLTTQKAKIDADTDLTTLKTDLQAVVKSYRVYAVYLPEIQLLSASDRLDTIISEITQLQTTLQSDIQSAQAQGENVSLLVSEMGIMQSKITDASKQSQNATTAAEGLTPQGFPGNRSTMQSARTDLQTGKQDLVTAAQQAKLIIQRLKLLGVKNPRSASSSANASPSAVSSTSAHP